MTYPNYIKMRKEWGIENPMDMTMTQKQQNKSVKQVLSLFQQKLDIALGVRFMNCQLMRQPNGLRQVENSENYTEAMVQDRLFMMTGVEEDELWEMMARS